MEHIVFFAHKFRKLKKKVWQPPPERVSVVINVASKSGELASMTQAAQEAHLHQ